MKATTLLLSFLLTCVSTFAESERPSESEGPLNITVPKGWRVTYKDEKYFGGMPSYVLQPDTSPDSGLLILYMGSSVSSSNIPSLLDASAKSVAQDMKRSGFDAKFTTGTLRGEVFSGKFVEFSSPSEDLVQTIVLISDGQTVLNAHYNGSESGWKEAIRVLATLKQKGNRNNGTTPSH